MVSEDAVVFDLNNIVLVVWVMLLQMLQNSQLHSCLMLVSLFILDDLDCYDLACLVVKALNGLSKTAFAQEVKHLEAVVQMILEHDMVVTLVVIIAIVMQFGRSFAFDFLSLKA